MTMYVVKVLVKALLLPPTGLLLLAIGGICLWRSRPRMGRAITAGAVCTLFALSLPVVSQLLVLALNPPAPFDEHEASNAKAVVILGGGVRRMAPEYGGDTLTSFTLERVRYGARIARATGLPVLVSGGSVHGAEAEAILMKGALEDEFSVPVRWVEDQSRDTHENAVQTARILRSANVQTVILVMHAVDMRRARAEFASAGIQTIPAATNVPQLQPITMLDWIPGPAAFQTSYFASYEIVANLARVAASVSAMKEY